MRVIEIDNNNNNNNKRYWDCPERKGWNKEDGKIISASITDLLATLEFVQVCEERIMSRRSLLLIDCCLAALRVVSAQVIELNENRTFFFALQSEFLTIITYSLIRKNSVNCIEIVSPINRTVRMEKCNERQVNSIV
jgi:hypothetical protein